MAEFVTYELHGAVMQITLNRPEKKNAINNAMWLEIAAAFQAAADNQQVACVLLCGSGGNFCAGVDLASFGEEVQGDEHPFDIAAKKVADFDKPLVAAATGVAIGGGATVLFHADVVYVGEGLRMRLPFASLGLAPEWASSYMLQANIGAQNAAELFYTAAWIDAPTAVSRGIAVQALPDDALLAHAMEKAQEIAQWPVNSLREIKRCLRLPHRAPIQAAFAQETEAMGRQAGSPENIEAITAFMEKRKPDFSKL